MSDAAAAKRERAEQILGELAELGLMLARDLAVQARAAEEPEEKVALTEAFQKTSRAVRLTLALDFKLQRDAARDAREEAKDAQAEATAARHDIEAAPDEDNTPPSPETRQKTRVKRVLDRLIWNEAEGDSEEYDVLLEDLDVRLDLASEVPGFADLPIEVLAHKLKTDMRLPGELVVTTAETIVPANTPQPPLADTG